MIKTTRINTIAAASENMFITNFLVSLLMSIEISSGKLIKTSLPIIKGTATKTAVRILSKSNNNVLNCNCFVNKVTTKVTATKLLGLSNLALHFAYLRMKASQKLIDLA